MVRVEKAIELFLSRFETLVIDQDFGICLMKSSASWAVRKREKFAFGCDRVSADVLK
jgi:hypothetical protein